ncbi:MAG: hotdog fold thioesterase [Methanoregula sp.]|nr:hotdog fold thioesterase [Methanoregula sp.]
MTENTGDPDPDLFIQEQINSFNTNEYARLLGMTVTDARPGYARVEMESMGKYNCAGAAHGGAIFSLADHAFGVASNCDGIHRTAVTVHVQYIAPATGPLVAVAERISGNGSCDMYRMTVRAGDRLVAVCDGVAFRV